MTTKDDLPLEQARANGFPPVSSIRRSTIDLGDLQIIFPCQPPASVVEDPEGTLAEQIDPHEDVILDTRTKDRERRASELIDPRVVKFETGDPHNPLCWSRKKKWAVTMYSSFLVLNATLASSAPSGVFGLMVSYFEQPPETVILVTSLFLVGYVIGPLLFAPLSEVFGRRPVFIVSFFCYTMFNLGCALSTSIGSLLACRLLAGTFAAAPITNSGGVVADVWELKDRGSPMGYFSLAPFAGPVLGPLIAGYLGMASGSFRPIFWLLFAFSAACWIGVLFLPETYGPVLLKTRAQKIRKEFNLTVEECRAPMEAEGRSLAQVLKISLSRPLSFIFTELIVFLVSLYVAFVYGVLYLLFTAFPIVFVGIYNFNPGESGLAFLGVGVGASFAILVVNRLFDGLYVKTRDPETGRLIPEMRLPSTFVGGPVFALSMFWFGWSAGRTHWIVPLLAGIPLGGGVVSVFTASLSYLADCYTIYAASAIAANTIARSIFGAVFPLFSQQMYRALGVAWASTLLGGLGLLLVPVPFLFFKFGKQIRSRSKFAAG